MQLDEGRTHPDNYSFAVLLAAEEPTVAFLLSI